MPDSRGRRRTTVEATRGVEILEDFFFVERGYLSGNHFALRAAEPVLVDTAYASEIPKTLGALEALGCDWRRTAQILCTHGHCDHVGANRAIQDASGCTVAMHPVGRGFADAGDRWSPWYDFYLQEAPPFACAAGLEDGEEVPIGPHRFRVLHTPGHAADGVVLYEPRAEVLLSSDTLWERDIPVVTEAVEGGGALDALLGSLDRIAGLRVGRVYPGHGAPFTDFHGAVDRARSRVRAYRQDRARLGDDLLKRILVYTLLMKGPVPEADLFALLLRTPWFPDTVRRYFGGEADRKYRETLDTLRGRGAVCVAHGMVATTVRP